MSVSGIKSATVVADVPESKVANDASRVNAEAKPGQDQFVLLSLNMQQQFGRVGLKVPMSPLEDDRFLKLEDESDSLEACHCCCDNGCDVDGICGRPEVMYLAVDVSSE